MQRLPFDKRIGPFFRFISPLFEIFETPPPPQHHQRHPPPPRATHPPPPDYDSFVDALKDFKHVCMNYCSCHDDEEKSKEKKEQKEVIIEVKGGDEDE